MKEKLSERKHRICYIDDTEAARKMKEKLPNIRCRSCQEDKRENSGEDTEAAM
jgi:hypothetical protein